jgi:hypothetical protein
LLGLHFGRFFRKLIWSPCPPQVHSHLQLDDSNPFRRGLKPLSNFLALPNIPFFKREVDLKGSGLLSLLKDRQQGLMLCSIKSALFANYLRKNVRFS